MFQSVCVRYALFLLLIASASNTMGAESIAPRITAQGFDISLAQEGMLGDFGPVRVRFEVPDRIAELYIKERSYDVDLAITPDMAHFPLFGLKTQVRQLTDVTLNFQNYINEKLESTGDYTIELRVIDRKGNSASASLQVRVIDSSTTVGQSDNGAVTTNPFRFVRTGSSPVIGAEQFGITWRTIESDSVTIELKQQNNGAQKLIELSASDFDEITTIKALEEKTSSGNDTSTLQLATAGDKASGTVFVVVNQNGHYVLKVTRSATSVSPRGTTVTLVGEYKH